MRHVGGGAAQLTWLTQVIFPRSDFDIDTDLDCMGSGNAPDGKASVRWRKVVCCLSAAVIPLLGTESRTSGRSADQAENITGLSFGKTIRQRTNLGWSFFG